ncbi:hypothetical protein HDU96_005182, partial [Phlyctochytrium bullatum]
MSTIKAFPGEALPKDIGDFMKKYTINRDASFNNNCLEFDLGMRWTNPLGMENEKSKILVAVSGAGKTRRVYEELYSRPGIFFTCSKQGNGGSEDLRSCLQEINDDPDSAASSLATLCLCLSGTGLDYDVLREHLDSTSAKEFPYETLTDFEPLTISQVEHYAEHFLRGVKNRKGEDGEDDIEDIITTLKSDRRFVGRPRFLAFVVDQIAKGSARIYQYTIEHGDAAKLINIGVGYAKEVGAELYVELVEEALIESLWSLYDPSVLAITLISGISKAVNSVVAGYRFELLILLNVYYEAKKSTEKVTLLYGSLTNNLPKFDYTSGWVILMPDSLAGPDLIARMPDGTYRFYQ